jgi:hypothetical protein
MAQFIVESKHTPEDCLASLDEIMAYDPKLLDQFLWGCKSGEHTGWAMFEGESEEDIKNMLPESMKKDARIIPVAHFTPAQIEAAHK